MECYLVGIKQKDLDNQGYTILLSQNDLAYLLLNIDDEKYEIVEVLKTFTEKGENILPFCKKTDKLETGGNS